jgi:hypothetical protein
MRNIKHFHLNLFIDKFKILKTRSESVQNDKYFLNRKALESDHRLK